MRQLIFIVLTIFSSVVSNAQKLQDPGQPVTPAPGVKVLPEGTCHWGYSIRRTKETNEGKYYYQITFSLDQIDSRGNPAGPTVIMENANIICSFKLGKKKYSIRFFPEDDVWVANFFIKTYRAVPLTITAEYNHQKSLIKEPVLNSGRYPGED